MKFKKCGECYWYRWEDSVWGYCWRFPPKRTIRKIFPKIRYKQTYPEVLLDGIACGEFKSKIIVKKLVNKN